MALPQVDPSLPGGAAPVFGDTDAARGDHLRANNQAIWENLEYLNDGENINDASAATPVDADRMGFWQIVGGIIKYVTFANLFAYIVSKLIAVTTKTTPVDADAVLLRDSEASNAPKWLSFTNLKAFLKTYFDILYIVPYAKLSDTKTAGTGAGTFTSGAWRTRTINTEDNDSAGIVSLSANQFILQAGTYRINARACAYQVNSHKARLYNITDSTTTLVGTPEVSGVVPTYATAWSKIAGEFTIAGAKTFEIQHYCSNTGAFGDVYNIGVNEIYLLCEIWKVG